MSPSNSVLPFSRFHLLYFLVCQVEVLQLVQATKFVVLLGEGFGFDFLEGFEVLGDFPVDY